MAYKFQRGDAILSGSIKAEDGLVATDVDATTADFVVAALTDGDIPFSKLAIADAKILIGDNANGHAQEFALSGDVTMTAGGVVAIGADKVQGTMLHTNAADTSTIELSSNTLSVLKVPNALAAGNGISGSDFDGAAGRSFAIDLSGSANGLNVTADGLALKLSGSGDGFIIDAGGLAFNADPDSFSLHPANGLQLDANVAGNGLALSTGVLSVGVDGSSVEVFSDALRVKALGITNAMLGGSIANAKLANSTISGKALGTNLDALAVDDSSIEYSAGSAFNGSAASTIRVKAGGISNAMLADDAVGADELASNAVVDASVHANAAILASKINFNTDLGGNISFGNQADDDVTFGGGVVVAGNLTVQGSTTTVDSTTINISSSFTFEGPADDHETILTCATPGADTTLSLPTLSAGSYFIPALADAATDASAAVTAAEFALLDGGTSAASSITVADADRMIINDAGSMKQIAMSDVKSYVAGASTLSVAAKADGNALEEDKVNYFADLSSNATVTLPASAAGLVGKSIYIKAKDLTSGATIIINTQASGQKIDGENSIVLESPYASVRLIYVATDDWRVF